MKKKLLLIATVILSLLALVACGDKTEKTNNEGKEEVKEINVGYFPNLSHAPAMIGIEKGIFEKNLEGVKVTPSTFPDGSVFMDSLLTGKIDIGYVGPGPVLNRYLQGGEVVLISNATIGENVLVVRKDLEIKTGKDLEGKTVATASTGCTHDILLRKMLKEEGSAVEENGGKVKRMAQKPAATMGLLEQKQIDATVVSEPWASQMEAEGVGKVVRDYNELPWNGELPATVLVVSKDFLEKNPDLVDKFIKAHEESIDFINNNKKESVDLVAKNIEDATEQSIDKKIIESSFKRVEFTSKINKDVLQEFADLLKELDFIKEDSNLENLFWSKLK